MMVNITPERFFDWIFFRLAWAGGCRWYFVDFRDGSTYEKVFLCFYWRVKDANSDA